jgi:hypothetical protein
MPRLAYFHVPSCVYHSRLWHAAEVFGGAAIPSGYRGTFTVLAKQPAGVLLTDTVEKVDLMTDDVVSG